MLNYIHIHELINLIRNRSRGAQSCKKYSKLVQDVADFLTNNIVMPSYEDGKKDAVKNIHRLIVNSVYEESRSSGADN